MDTHTTLQAKALATWQENASRFEQSAHRFMAHNEPCFLVLLATQQASTPTSETISEWVRIALAEQACQSAAALSAVSLWTCFAHASLTSECHLFLNLDLLTIDAHAQDWGDYKIKPEQVEVQRNELTHAALFEPRTGFIVQVLKSALPTFNTMLREAGVSAYSTEIGKTWGQCHAGEAQLDIYRDAKKQAAFSAADLQALHNLII